MSSDESFPELSVMEAVDILSNMAEVDLKEVPDEEEADEVDSTEINWRDPRQAMQNQPLIQETFRVLHRYLQNMVRSNRNVLHDGEKMRGVQALLLLAAEAVHKMDRYAGLYPKKYNAISKLKEYTDLQKYYKQQILKQMPIPPEEGEDWEIDLEDIPANLEVEKRGLRDLEAVRKDQTYELFFIKNENDRAYYSRSLLRHIRLVGNFDELVSKAEGEDPLLRVREHVDRELYQGAKEILKKCAPFIDEFYTQGMKLKEKPFVGSLNKAVMALRMAANPKNLIENQSFKSCIEYYADFHRFLRDALEAPGYKKAISGEATKTVFTQSLVHLTHALCCYFFQRIEPEKEAVTLIHSMIERGERMRGPRPKKTMSVWEELIDQDESIRLLLRYFPNGPILRTLDAFREDEESEGWDPLQHHNFPSQVFTFSGKELHVSVLRMPCPVQQVYINRAQIGEEFNGLLRFYEHDLKADNHLLINLQDRTSWREYARCVALEETSLRAEHYSSFYVLGLPKNTSFYSQVEEYSSMSGAPVFLEQFKSQILSGEDCGFYLPESMEAKAVESFVGEAFSVIHKYFFEGKNQLSRAERTGFIEIFYLLFALKILDLKKSDSISFTCKDAVDAGMGQTAIFYGFLRLCSEKKPLTKQELDHLIWILYSPALFIRERVIHQDVFQRVIHTLEQIDHALLKDHKGAVQALGGLYKTLKFPLDIQFD